MCLGNTSGTTPSRLLGTRRSGTWRAPSTRWSTGTSSRPTLSCMKIRSTNGWNGKASRTPSFIRCPHAQDIRTRRSRVACLLGVATTTPARHGGEAMKLGAPQAMRAPETAEAKNADDGDAGAKGTGPRRGGALPVWQRGPRRRRCTIAPPRRGQKTRIDENLARGRFPRFFSSVETASYTRTPNQGAVARPRSQVQVCEGRDRRGDGRRGCGGSHGGPGRVHAERGDAGSLGSRRPKMRRSWSEPGGGMPGATVSALTRRGPSSRRGPSAASQHNSKRT